jgi:hypothetical protein
MADSLSVQVEKVFSGYTDPARLFTAVKPYVEMALTVLESEVRERAPDGASGGLKSSIKHRAFDDPTNPLIGEVYVDSESGADKYAVFVELGRGPGKMPPISALLPWVRRKLKAEVMAEAANRTRPKKNGKPRKPTKDRVEMTERSIAFRIARVIGEEGTEATHFMELGFAAAEKEAQEIIERGIEIAIDKLNSEDGSL